jgi:hypothetical protein
MTNKRTVVKHEVLVKRLDDFLKFGLEYLKSLGIEDCLSVAFGQHINGSTVELGIEPTTRGPIRFLRLSWGDNYLILAYNNLTHAVIDTAVSRKGGKYIVAGDVQALYSRNAVDPEFLFDFVNLIKDCHPFSRGQKIRNFMLPT